MTQSLLAVLGDGLLDPDTPVLRADDAGLTRGDGCFEGCRVRDGVVDKLEAHLARMARSALALGIDFDPQPWRELVASAVAAWPAAGEAAMRLVLTRGPANGASPTGLLTVSPLPEAYPRQRRDGIRAVTLCRGTAGDAYQDAPWLLGGVKTLSYAVNMAAQREAIRRGAEDVIFVSSDGLVLEAPTSSVLWWAEHTLHTTPTGASGILGGTTQQLLFDRAADAGWRTATSPVQVRELHRAGSLWLLGTVRGPVDVVELDGRPRGRDLARTAQVRALCGF